MFCKFNEKHRGTKSDIRFQQATKIDVIKTLFKFVAGSTLDVHISYYTNAANTKTKNNLNSFSKQIEDFLNVNAKTVTKFFNN